MSKFIKPLGDKSILSPNFQYTSAAKTDIRETCRRFKSELSTRGQDLEKPLVINPGCFVLPIEWLELKD